jgi:hypothetical protein
MLQYYNEFVNWDLSFHSKQCVVLLFLRVFSLKMVHVDRNISI